MGSDRPAGSRGPESRRWGISIGLLQSQAEREGRQGQTDTGHGPFTQEACDSHLPCPPHLPSPHLLNSDSKTKTKTKPDLFLTSLKTNYQPGRQVLEPVTSGLQTSASQDMPCATTALPRSSVTHRPHWAHPPPAWSSFGDRERALAPSGGGPPPSAVGWL